MGFSLPQLFLSNKKCNMYIYFKLLLRKIKIEVGTYAGKMVYKKQKSKF